MKLFLTLAVVAFCAITTQATPLCGGPGLLLCQPLGGATELDAGLGYSHGYGQPLPLGVLPLGGGMPLGHLNLIKKFSYAPKPLLLKLAPVAPVAPIVLAHAPPPPAPAPQPRPCGCMEHSCSCMSKK